MRIGTVTWARYARNKRSLPHAVLSYKGFAQGPKGEIKATWEGDSIEKRVVETAQFRIGGRESETSRSCPVRPDRTQAAARWGEVFDAPECSSRITRENVQEGLGVTNRPIFFNSCGFTFGTKPSPIRQKPNLESQILPLWSWAKIAKLAGFNIEPFAFVQSPGG